jgi:maltokinase
VIFGDTVILKVFRKVSPGLNPDIEVHSALAAAGSTHIAAPLGWLEGAGRDATGDRRTASLAMAQSSSRTRPTAGSSPSPASATSTPRPTCTPTRSGATSPARRAARSGHRRGARGARRGAADRPPARARSSPRSPTACATRLDRAAAEVRELTPYVDALRPRFDDLAALDTPVAVQRVHGDYHLGQVMRTLDGWKLLDFEGEPARPLAERRALESPVKDVAGCCARSTTPRDTCSPTTRSTRSASTAPPSGQSGTGTPSAPGTPGPDGPTPRTQPVLLRAFETDKAVYEVLYEARNRPSWLQIPMAAIRRLAAQDDRVSE